MRPGTMVKILLCGLLIACGGTSRTTLSAAADDPPYRACPYQSYELHLSSFCPTPSRIAGVLLRTSINGGRPLRLILDSGAESIVIGSKDALSAGLSRESAMDLVGLDSTPASVGHATTVQIGPVCFRNCPVAFVKGRVVEGADGVIPLSLFSDFVLRLNLPEKRLGLIPYPQEGNSGGTATHGVTQHNLLLVDTVLNGKQNGYVVMDTGAYCSAISAEVAHTLKGFPLPLAPQVHLAAGTGAATGQRVSSRVHFAIANQDLIPDEVVALDLSNLSRHYGVEVMGVLGFPALQPYVLTIDYRNQMVKIEPNLHTSP